MDAPYKNMKNKESAEVLLEPPWSWSIVDPATVDDQLFISRSLLAGGRERERERERDRK